MNAGRFTLALALILISVTGWTQTTSLLLTDDTHIADDAGDWLQAERNYGSRPLMLVHDWGPFHALVRFDATAISGQTVDSATLRLYLADLRTGGSISVHAITSPWTESSVTWNTGPSYEPVAETVIEVGSADVGSVVSVDITSLAAKWASGAQQNHGVLLRTIEPVRAVFDTKETPSGVPAELEVTASTGPSVYAKVLDFTDPDDCTIDEAGYYILDRSWDLSPPEPQGACSNAADPLSRGVRIVADEVTIDFRGFELKLMDPNFTDYGFATIRTDASGFVLRNGTLVGYYALSGIQSSPTAALMRGSGTIQNMTVLGRMELRYGTIRNSHIEGDKLIARFYLAGEHPSPRIVVDNSTFVCSTRNQIDATCLHTDGFDAQYLSATIRNSRFIGLGSIRVNSLETIVAGNLFRTNLTIENSYVISARGIIIKNVVLNESQIGDGVRLQGGPAIVDSNIVRGGKVGIFQPYETEICYLGNNRLSAVIPQQGIENCVDWGGNVSF